MPFATFNPLYIFEMLLYLKAFGVDTEHLPSGEFCSREIDECGTGGSLGIKSVDQLAGRGVQRLCRNSVQLVGVQHKTPQFIVCALAHKSEQILGGPSRKTQKIYPQQLLSYWPVYRVCLSWSASASRSLILCGRSVSSSGYKIADA